MVDNVKMCKWDVVGPGEIPCRVFYCEDCISDKKDMKNCVACRRPLTVNELKVFKAVAQDPSEIMLKAAKDIQNIVEITKNYYNTQIDSTNRFSTNLGGSCNRLVNFGTIYVQTQFQNKITFVEQLVSECEKHLKKLRKLNADISNSPNSIQGEKLKTEFGNLKGFLCTTQDKFQKSIGDILEITEREKGVVKSKKSNPTYGAILSLRTKKFDTLKKPKVAGDVNSITKSALVTNSIADVFNLDIANKVSIPKFPFSYIPSDTILSPFIPPFMTFSYAIPNFLNIPTPDVISSPSYNCIPFPFQWQIRVYPYGNQTFPDTVCVALAMEKSYTMSQYQMCRFLSGAGEKQMQEKFQIPNAAAPKYIAPLSELAKPLFFDFMVQVVVDDVKHFDGDSKPNFVPCRVKHVEGNYNFAEPEEVDKKLLQYLAENEKTDDGGAGGGAKTKAKETTGLGSSLMPAAGGTLPPQTLLTLKHASSDVLTTRIPDDDKHIGIKGETPVFPLVHREELRLAYIRADNSLLLTFGVRFPTWRRQAEAMRMVFNIEKEEESK